MRKWEKARLADCCDIVSGATPSTNVPAYWNGDICWATPKDLSELDGAYISDTPRKLTRAGLDSCAATVLPENSVLFSSRAPIGHVAVNTVALPIPPSLSVASGRSLRALTTPVSGATSVRLDRAVRRQFMAYAHVPRTAYESCSEAWVLWRPCHYHHGSSVRLAGTVAERARKGCRSRFDDGLGRNASLLQLQARR